MTIESQLPAYMAQLDRIVAKFVIDIRERLGLEVREQRDPGGRLVSYGFHWHQPDAQGVCPHWVVYGYPTELAALKAGLEAGIASGLTIEVAERSGPGDGLRTPCNG